MLTQREHAVEVFENWLIREHKVTREFELVRHLARLDAIMTGDQIAPTVADQAAAQAASRLSNHEFLKCLLKLPFRQQALTSSGKRVLEWLHQSLATAHSHVFSNVGLLLEIVLDQEDNHSVAQWDDATIKTATSLAKLSNAQLLTVFAELAGSLDDPMHSPVRQMVGRRYH
ncbi:hypothetical protein [Furfurilactobacillus entadae]|uniref:hypothetical protein n=1 Tax=Furfurilactobacillus entadae TaxID=2922307 RepID=UPI0035EF3992